jgi:uncharacterized protein (DUF2336 family)
MTVRSPPSGVRLAGAAAVEGLAPLNEAARVRLGAASGTPPDVLCGLATDASVTVRAGVAINPAAPAEADRTLAADADERVRALLARKLAALSGILSVPDQARLNRQARETLAYLIEDEAERVRAAIADVVKQMPDVPRELILRLARDTAVTVSDPVICLSPLLTAEDLLALLAAAPSPTIALSVARRPDLNEAISDAIAATADTAAIRALLANPSAAIRETTLDQLIACAAEHVDWHEPLVLRPTLPPRAARALSEMVATQLLDVLARRADLDPGVTRELRTLLAARLARPPGGTPSRTDITAEQALAEAQTLAMDGRLTEEVVLGATRRGEARSAAALLAVAAEVGLSVVDRAATLRSAKGLVSLTWRAGFSMQVAGPLQALLARLPPAQILPPGPAGTFPLAIEEMRWQLDFLGRMGR